jgi:hypothetical protein
MPRGSGTLTINCLAIPCEVLNKKLKKYTKYAAGLAALTLGIVVYVAISVRIVNRMLAVFGATAIFAGSILLFNVIANVTGFDELNYSLIVDFLTML